jgi:hypothetical protein
VNSLKRFNAPVSADFGRLHPMSTLSGLYLASPSAS